ncbi:MAG: hypothetical protein KDA53_13660 [Hyphomonas sp.]|nr:hypothetical protein [Hyphomonas sp.]
MMKSTGPGLLALLAVTLAACGAAGNDAPPTAELIASAPAAMDGIGGSVDSVIVDAETGRVEVSGWHMLTPQTRTKVLTVYAPGASSVLSLEPKARPDVVTAINDEELANSGFTLVLQGEPGTGISELCIGFDDKHYGDRFLNANPDNPVRCTSKGQ